MVRVQGIGVSDEVNLEMRVVVQGLAVQASHQALFRRLLEPIHQTFRVPT